MGSRSDIGLPTGLKPGDEPDDWPTRRVGRNHECRRPKRLIFLDCETYPEVHIDDERYKSHSFRLAVVKVVDWPAGKEPNETLHRFTNALEMWGFIRDSLSPRFVTWLYAHNATFDMTVSGFWEMIERKEVLLTLPGHSYKDSRTGEERFSEPWEGKFCVDDVPFIVECVIDDCRLNIVDTLNYYRSSLEELGRSLGVLKMHMPAFTDDDEVWFTYCTRDVEIINAAIVGLISEWQNDDRGNWQPTAASLAWSHYRHRHMPCEIILHQHGMARDLEGEAYLGGEVRCFFRGTCPGNVDHWDVNSLYPHVMMMNQFPVALIDFTIGAKLEMTQAIQERFATIADVLIETDEDSYPVRKGFKTVYPVGRFRAVLCGPELADAFAKGRVKEVFRMAYYKTGEVFRSYVDEWFGRKYLYDRAGDHVQRSFAKIMLNSLYGKFGQKTPVWEWDANVVAPDDWGGFPWRDPVHDILYHCRAIAGKTQRMVRREWCQHSFPAICAFVTSYARHRMRTIRRLLTSREVYYTDTDSIWCPSESSQALCDSPGLVGDGVGQLRLVGDYQEVQFHGVKQYTLEGTEVRSGIKPTDVRVGVDEWVGERFERGASILARKPDSTVRTSVRTIRMTRETHEGGYGDDGWYQRLLMY